MTLLPPTVDPAILTALAATGGAILIKAVERWLGRRNDNNNEAARIRTELREEVNRYRSENIRLEKELDEWRTKYWEKKKLLDSDELRINELETEVTTSANQIQQLSGSVSELLDTVKHLQEDE